MNKQYSPSIIIGIALGFVLFGYTAFAFTPPSEAPPGGNIKPPINEGAVQQLKRAGLLVNTEGPNVLGMRVFGGIDLGNVLISGFVIPRPSCNSGISGTLWFTEGSVGSKDTLEVCAKNAAGSYAWRLLF
jgi:hypothetical protein